MTWVNPGNCRSTETPATGQPSVGRTASLTSAADAHDKLARCAPHYARRARVNAASGSRSPAGVCSGSSDALVTKRSITLTLGRREPNHSGSLARYGCLRNRTRRLRNPYRAAKTTPASDMRLCARARSLASTICRIARAAVFPRRGHAGHSPALHSPGRQWTLDLSGGITGVGRRTANGDAQAPTAGASP